MDNDKEKRLKEDSKLNIAAGKEPAKDKAPEGKSEPEVRKKRRPQRDPRKPSPGNELFPSLRPKNPIGDLFYSLGMFAEAWVLHIGRFLRDSIIFFGQIFVWLFGDVVSKIFGVVWQILKDFFAPAVGFFTGILRLFQVSAQDKKKNREKTKGMSFAQYLSYGSKKYWQLVKNLFRLLLPLSTAVMLLLTMGTIFKQRYGLEVFVNDERVGFVANELVIGEAQKILRGRIKLAANQSYDAWEFKHKVAITPISEFSNQSQLADEIIRSSPNDIIEGRGIYVDDELYGATTEWEEMERYLNEKLQSATDSTIGGEPSFVRNIRLSKENEVFLKESEESFDQILQRMDNQDISEITHAVTDGQTLKQIEEQYSITHEALLARNPELGQRNTSYKPEEDTVLLIAYSQPFLQVKLSVREEEEVTIPFEVEKVDNKDMPKNSSFIKQKGIEGIKKVFYDSVYINKELVAKVEVEGSSQIILEAVKQIVEIGIKGVTPDIIISGAGWQYPLPGSTGSGRGFSGQYAHEGVDLSAPEGTAIVAAEAGTVIYAGWHSTLGNYVRLSHGYDANGMEITSVYAHASVLLVNAGEEVYRGKPIAIIGNTGRSYGTHLHFEVRVSGIPYNPYNWVTQLH